MPRRSRAVAQRGASLIEACTVVAVVSVLAASALPSFADLLERRRLDGHAAELAGHLQLVRSEALARNRPLRITFTSTAAGSCYLIHTGAAGACGCDGTGAASCTDPAATLIKSVPVPTASRISLAARAGSMVYDPVRGTVTPTNTIAVSDGKGREIRHVVSLMGRVRSCSPSAAMTGYKPC